MRDTKHAPPLAIMLGIGHADDPDGDGEDTSADDLKQAKKDAATALINAVKSDNADAVVDAIETLHELCGAEYDDEEEPDDESSDKPSIAEMMNR